MTKTDLLRKSYGIDWQIFSKFSNSERKQGVRSDRLRRSLEVAFGKRNEADDFNEQIYSRKEVARGLFQRYLATLPDDALGVRWDEIRESPGLKTLAENSKITSLPTFEKRFLALVARLEAQVETAVEAPVNQTRPADRGSSWPVRRFYASRSRLAVDIALGATWPGHWVGCMQTLDSVLETSSRGYEVQIFRECLDPQVKLSLTNLLLCAGLDPGTVTVRQMDELDLRFYCKVCLRTTRKPLALSWRDCVSNLSPLFAQLTEKRLSQTIHSFRHEADWSHTEGWGALSPKHSAIISRSQLLVRSDTTQRFRCKLCFNDIQHFGLADLEEHVRSEYVVVVPSDLSL